MRESERAIKGTASESTKLGISFFRSLTSYMIEIAMLGVVASEKRYTRFQMPYVSV